MTEFQKEVSVVALLLVFLFACSCFVETVPTGSSVIRNQMGTKKAVQSEDCESKCVTVDIGF